MSTRLSKEREAEIREYVEITPWKWASQQEAYSRCRDLLAEIDALREENRRLRDKAGIGPLLPPLYI